MASLRRLNIEGCRRLERVPNGIGRRNDVVVRLDVFAVAAAARDAGGGGCSSSSNIGELGGVNMHIPQGNFDICNLEEVGSRDEAQTAELEQKTCLQSLVLSWGDTRTHTRDYCSTYEKKSVVVAAGGVLEGLHPPPQLLYLKVRHYPGLTFPSWMGDGGAFLYLGEVELDYCENCTQLPPLGQLPSLERLTIAGLQGVRRVGREFFGGLSPTFPCLTNLTFRDMWNWSEWVATLPPTATTTTSTTTSTSTSTREEEEEEEGGGSELPPPVMPELHELALSSCLELEAVPPTF